MRVRLVKKLAQIIDGIDLSAYQPGDVLDLEPSEARLLVEEDWAEPQGRALRRYYVCPVSRASELPPAIAAERPRLSKLQRLAMKRHSITLPEGSEDLPSA